MKEKSDERAEYIPTPDQIRAACAEVRESWTESEFNKRSNYKISPYFIPFCEVSTSYSEFKSEENIYRRN